MSGSIKKEKYYNYIDRYDYLEGDAIEEKAPIFNKLIGEFLIRFSYLEHTLNIIIAESFIEDMVDFGYRVIENMKIATKIKLFYKLKFSELKLLKKDDLISKLEAINSFRNIIAHANWQSLTKKGFVRTKIIFKDYEMKSQEVKISERIFKTNIAKLKKVISELDKLTI